MAFSKAKLRSGSSSPIVRASRSTRWRALPTFLLGTLLAFLSYGCPPEPHVQPNMLCPPGTPFASLCPAGAAGFYDFPWPNNLRRRPGLLDAFDPAGALDFTGLPVGQGTLLDVGVAVVITSSAAKTHAFGNNAAIFFTLSQPSNPEVSAIDVAQLPSPAKTLEADSPIVLVNIHRNLDNSPSFNYGKKVPVKVDFKRLGTSLRAPNTLAILPYPGFPLAEGEKYAVVLYKGLKAGDGSSLKRAPLIDGDVIDSLLDNPAIVAPARGYLEELARQRDEVFAYAGANQNAVAGFTVFTTQTPFVKNNAVGLTLERMTNEPANLFNPAFKFEVDAATTRKCSSPDAPAAYVQGRLRLPRFQNGTPPYDGIVDILAGLGDIIVNPGGDVTPSWEWVTFQLVVPCSGQPTTGWPVAVVIGKTASNFDNAERNFVTPFYGGLPKFAVLSIAPHFSGERLTQLGRTEDFTCEGKPQPCFPFGWTFFNFLNPVAGRNNQRQQGAEIAYLSRFAEYVRIPKASLGTPDDFLSDAGKIGFYGHSQGAVPAPLGLAMHNRYKGAFLNAPGAGLYHAIVYRNDVRPLVDKAFFCPLDPAACPAPGTSEIDQFHPLLHVLQTLAEEGDAANYARRMGTTQGSLHVVMAAGVHDGCSEIEGVAHLAAAAGVQLGKFNLGAGTPAPPFLGNYAINTLQELVRRQTDPLAINPVKAPLLFPAYNNLPTGVSGAPHVVPNRTGLLVQLDGHHDVVLAEGNRWLVRSTFDSLFSISGEPTSPPAATLGSMYVANTAPSVQRDGCVRAYGLGVSSMVEGP